MLECACWSEIEAKKVKKNLEVKKKVVPLHSHLKNGWLIKLRVLMNTDAS